MINGGRILIIEDELNLRQNLCELLELHGYTVAVAGDGENGLIGLSTFHPDVVICDIKMPKMDGYELLETMRLYPHMKNLPFIFLSAKTEEKDIIEGLRRGANKYLTKPMKKQLLIETIQRCLDKRFDEVKLD
jgi:DNA-binding response OmpR family regulator